MVQRLQQISQSVLDAAKPFEPMIPLSSYLSFSIVLLSLGFVVSTYFIFNQVVNRNTSKLNILSEVISGMLASGFLGFGAIFGLVAAGLYV